MIVSVFLANHHKGHGGYSLAYCNCFDLVRIAVNILKALWWQHAAILNARSSKRNRPLVPIFAGGNS